MSRRLLLACMAGVLALAATALLLRGWLPGDTLTPEEQRTEIASLEAERSRLRTRVAELVSTDPRFKGMPETDVRFGVPTSLVRTLIEHVATGFVDQLTLELQDLRVEKTGTVKKVLPLGDYQLDVHIRRVVGQLQTGRPEVGFGGNEIAVALPIVLASGQGDAEISFDWDGRTVAGAVCGDLQVSREVAGSVRPDTYPMQGTLLLRASSDEILASPHFPPIEVRLRLAPSDESWQTVRDLIDEKRGMCGYVLEKVDVLGILERLLDKGFEVRLPTERLQPMAIPVGMESSMEVRGERVALGAKVEGLSITEHMLWLGADVSVSTAAGEEAPPATSPAAAAP